MVHPTGTYVHSVAASRRSERRRRLGCCRLSIVIGSATALIVLAVAVTTFAITYTTSLATVNRIGTNYVESIVDGGRVRVVGQYQKVADQVAGFTRALQLFEPVLPSDEDISAGQEWATLARAELHATHMMMELPDLIYSILAAFNDGSAVTLVREIPNLISVTVVSTRTIPANQTCCGIGYHHDITVTPRTFDDGTTGSVFQHTPAGVRGYTSQRPYVRGAPHIQSIVANIFRTAPGGTAVWSAPSFLVTNPVDPTNGTTCLPIAFPLRNSTEVIGVGYGCVTMDGVRALLVSLPLTENARVVVLDRQSGGVTASTAQEVPLTFSFTQNPSLRVDDGCSISSWQALEATDSGNYTIACWPSAASFDDAAVRAASRDRDLMNPQADVLQVRKMAVDDELLYVASASVVSSGANFPLILLVLLPEGDIVGDLRKSRGVVLGVVAAVTTVAAAASGLIVVAVLRQVSLVSAKMNRVAQLDDTDSLAGGAVESVNGAPTPQSSAVEQRGKQKKLNLSPLREVAELQLAFDHIHRAMHSFTRYVPRDVVKDLMAQGELCAIRMAPANCTMLFCDIAGFTPMCEKVNPDALSKLVALYFDTMSQVVMRHGGLIDKFIGDCIMAVWGAPFPIDHKEVRSTLCAVQMYRICRTAPLCDAFDEEGEALSVRIGIATGGVLAGNMGSADRMNYTVIGDAVNLASRLESLNKQLGTSILVCGATQECLGAWFCERLLFRIRVVGKGQAVAVYNVIGVAPTDALLDWSELATIEPDRETKATRLSSLAATAGYAATLDRHEAVEPLMQAARSTSVAAPLVVTAAMDAAARAYTAAAVAFAKRQLQDVGRLLDDIPFVAEAFVSSNSSGGDGGVDDVAEGGGVPLQGTDSVVYQWGENAMASSLLRRLVSSASDDFDGTWKPNDK